MENVLSIEEIFNKRILQVPAYQRGYAWEEEQWVDFIEDLEILGSHKAHYTGTLVLHRSDLEPFDDNEGRRHEIYNIVDGQQRLTTIIILLYVLSQQIAKFSPHKALSAGIQKNFISILGLNEQPQYKLILNDDCQKFFEENILQVEPSPNGPQIQSHHRLLGAKTFFSSYLKRVKKQRGDDYGQYLNALYTKVSHQLKVSLYEVESSADVGVIFEVMNNRGKPLTELEKVKNYLLYIASKLDVQHHQLSGVINNAWSTIFQRLMAFDLASVAEENQLLRTHWFMVYDPNRKNWDGSKSIKQYSEQF